MPVAPIVVWDDDEEQMPAQVNEVSDPAAPFGGFKLSGLGREGACDGIRAYQETQYYSVEWT